MCFSLHAWMCVHVCVCLGVLVCVGGNGLICLCILTMFIRAAAAALMRNTFGLILLPHAMEMGVGGGLLGYNPCLFSTHNIWTGLPSLLTALWLHPHGNNFVLKHISFCHIFTFSPHFYGIFKHQRLRLWETLLARYICKLQGCAVVWTGRQWRSWCWLYVESMLNLCLFPAWISSASVSSLKKRHKKMIKSSLTLPSLLPAAEELNSAF